jgi:anti-anti-sigma regulatory factor
VVADADWAIVRVTDQLGADTNDDFLLLVEALLQRGCRSIALDVSALAHVDVIRLGTLAAVKHRCRISQAEISYRGASGEVSIVLVATGLVESQRDTSDAGQ